MTTQHRPDLLERFLCGFLGHKLVREKKLSLSSDKIGCMRCQRKWAMNHDVRTFLPWDEDFERLYADIERLTK